MKTSKEKTKSFSNPDTRILATEVHEGFLRVDEKFERVDKRFESMQREMNIRFDAILREMDIRFEGVDRRFTSIDQKFHVVYWIMGTGFALVLTMLGIIMRFVIL